MIFTMRYAYKRAVLEIGIQILAVRRQTPAL